MTELAPPPTAPSQVLEPDKIGVGEFIRRMPVGTLLTILGAVLSGGAGTGYLVRGLVDDGRIQQLQDKAGAANSLALANEKRAEDLQRAIAAGSCVKSRELARADAARGLVGKLALMKTELDTHQKALTSQTAGWIDLNDLDSDPTVLGYFIDDENLRQLLVSVRAKRVGFIAGRSDVGRIEMLRSALVGAQEYLRAKYLPLDPSPSASPSSP